MAVTKCTIWADDLVCKTGSHIKLFFMFMTALWLNNFHMFEKFMPIPAWHCEANAIHTGLGVLWKNLIDSMTVGMMQDQRSYEEKVDKFQKHNYKCWTDKKH